MNEPRICVLGACNVDLTSIAARMPEWGETIRGTNFNLSYGGKGANQAVIAAKLGAEVSMISIVGDDMFGQGIIDNIAGFGIDVSHIKTSSECGSGVAQIIVDEIGNNGIIVVTGASDLITVDDVVMSHTRIASADVLLVQWEMPIEVSLAAMGIAEAAGVKVIFSPAPMGPNLPDEVYPLCDTICLNETEMNTLCGATLNNIAEIEDAAKTLLVKGVRSIVVTLGSKGALYVSKTESFMVGAQKVRAKDTTGAGDCFCGSLAFWLAQGDSIRRAMDKATRIAGISVQGYGTQDSYPDKKELEFLF